MKNQSIKDYYFVVQGWMLEELDLKGCELSLFAIIYGFSQGMNICDISLNYLSKLTGYTKKTVLNGLDSLVKKEFIARIQNTSLLSNKKLRNSYQVLVLPGSVRNTPSSSVNITPQTDFIEILKNNLKNNKNINKSQLLEMKRNIVDLLNEKLADLEKIIKTPWIDD